VGSWSQAGRILRELREGRGWTHARLAVELERQARATNRTVPGRTTLIRRVYEWEAGTHRPRDYYVLFVLVYASADELAARAPEPNSDLDRLMTAVELMGVPMDRRKFLLNSAALAAGVTLVPALQEDRSILELFDDDPLPHAVGRLQYLAGLQHAGEPAEPVYVLLSRHASDLDRLAGRFKGSDVERELRTVQAWTLATVGHTAFAHLGNHAMAEEHFRAGMQAARQSSDPRLRAALCVELARRRLHDPTDDARTSLFDALWVVNSGFKFADGNPLVLADLHNTRALVCASLGNGHGANEALVQAAQAVESVRAGDSLAWLPDIHSAQVKATSGISHLRLGDAGRAADELEGALDAIGSNRLHAALLLAYAAEASAKLKEPEHAVSLLHEAIPTVSTSKSVLRAQAIRNARATLQPWDGELFVRELDDRLATLSQ